MTIPIYVTRPTATGKTGQIHMGQWMYSFVAWLVTLNLTLWGLVGGGASVKLIFEAFS